MDNSRYSDREYIGSGGMASVYKAFDRTLQRYVAVKEMAEQMRGNQDVIKLFLDEARKMAAVRDKNVVQVYDVIDQGDVPSIVMELMEGGSIASKLGPGALPVEDVVDILGQVASGLRAIHNAGVIHRDVKPENIIEDKGIYKITDFGVAMSGDEDTLPFVTSKYAAPEVLLEPNKIDRQSDLYSLGMMAIELLLGTRRFEEVVRETIEKEQSVELPAIQDSAQAFWQQWVASSAVLPPLNQLDDTIPADVANLIGRLVSREKEARIADCDTLLRELTDIKAQVRQVSTAPTMHNAKLARKLEKLKAEREKAATAPAVPQKQKKKGSFGLKLVGGVVAFLVLAFTAFLFWPTGFHVDVVTEPAGAIVTYNGQRFDGYPTPTWFDAAWGDTFVFELDGEAPVELVLSEGMAGLTPTDEGFRLDVNFDAPPTGDALPTGDAAPNGAVADVIDTSAKAARAVREWLSSRPTLAVTLEGAAPDADGAYHVPLGTNLSFVVSPAGAGTLTMVHLGADDAASLIYPAPDGDSVDVDAQGSVSVGNELGLVTSEPVGQEWFVFLVGDEARNPPAIDGMQPIGAWARRYPFAEDGSAGQDLIAWLLDAGDATYVTGALVPVEIVR